MTNFPNGISSMGVPVGGMMTQGNTYFVKPYSGNDGNSGKTIDAALKTLAAALALATANQNDVIYLCQENNTASKTTDYQSVTLDWNKDSVHLIGIGNGPSALIGQRSRIAFISTYATASNLFTLSANNCLIKGIEFFEGVADTNPTGCMKVTGTRNVIENCQISGIGATTNDLAAAYSLSIQGDENRFNNCYIGLDTVIRATALGEVRIVSGTRTIFDNCIIQSYTSLTTFKAIITTAGSYHTTTWLRNCMLVNDINRTGAVTVTGAISHSAAGIIACQNTLAFGYTNLTTADDSNVLVNSPIALGKDQGVARGVDVT